MVALCKRYCVQAILALAFIYPFWVTFNGNFIVLFVFQLIGVNEDTRPEIYLLNFAVLVVCAVGLFHALFWRLVVSVKQTKHQKALVKAIDYVWYSMGVVLLLLLLNQMQLVLMQDWENDLRSEENRYWNLRTEYRPKAIGACDVVLRSEYDPTQSEEQYSYEREDHQFMRAFCTGITTRDRSLTESEWCTSGGRSFYPSNSATFWTVEGRPEEVTSAYNTIDSFCTFVLETKRKREKIEDYETVIGVLSKYPRRESDPFLYFYFALVLGLRITKVTIDVAQSYR